MTASSDRIGRDKSKLNGIQYEKQNESNEQSCDRRVEEMRGAAIYSSPIRVYKTMLKSNRVVINFQRAKK